MTYLISIRPRIQEFSNLSLECAIPETDTYQPNCIVLLSALNDHQSTIYTSTADTDNNRHYIGTADRLC